LNFKILLLLLLPIILFSKGFELQTQMKGLDTTNMIAVYEDPTRELTIEQVKKQSFKIQKKNITNYGVSSSVYWIRLKIHNPQSQNLTWSIKFLFGLFDHMEMWQYADDQLLLHTLKGDHHIDPEVIPFNERTVFTFNTEANVHNTVYFKISHDKAGLIEMFNTIWTQDELNANSQIFTIMLTAIFTALIVLFFYNLFIYFVLKNRVYFWYVLYLIGVMLVMTTFNQLGSHFIWSKWFQVEDIMPFVGFVMANASFLMFTRVFLETKKRLKRIDIFLLTLIAIDLLALLFALADFRIIAIKLIGLIGFSFAFFPLFGLYLWNKGFTIARGYTLATAILSITMTMSILRFTGLVPTTEFMFWMIRLGFVIEGILLAIALADRINIIERSYHSLQDKLTHKLESEVEKRTLELEEAKKIAENLARKDMLTGVWNRRAFSEMSEKLLQDSKRHDIPLSLIMIDIDKFKNINDNYGHKAGDIVLTSFAKNLSVQTRDSDLLSRIGGEEFVIVLPHSNLADATKKAEHFRLDTQAQPINVKDTILNITVSIGVAQFNPKQDSLDTLLARADKAMYYVKSHGRDGVHSIQY
jgi:diguanylate cyclase (GGDEF)-like protein